MYEKDYMYAVERNGEYLAHFGIKGMKWGVRKKVAVGAGLAAGGAAAAAAALKLRRAGKLVKGATNTAHSVNNAANKIRTAANTARAAAGKAHYIADGGARLTRVTANAANKIAAIDKARQAAQRAGAVASGALRSPITANARSKIAAIDKARQAAQRSGAVIGAGGARLPGVANNAVKKSTHAVARTGLSGAQMAQLGIGAAAAGLAGYGIYRGVKAYKAHKAKMANGGGQPRHGGKKRRR